MKKTLLNAIAWITGASKIVVAFLLPILRDSTSQLLSVLLPIALDAVSSMATSNASGDEKRKAAADQIKAAAIQAGVQATSRAVNLAIELALEKLQEAK